MPVTPGQYWNLAERRQPVAKRRASHAKVRTGCVTCKNRRVKCDERRPRCFRCEKSGHLCAGYEDVSAKHDRSIAPPDASVTVTVTSRSIAERAVVRPRPLQPRRAVDAHQPFSIEVRLPISLMSAYLDTHDGPLFERLRSQILMDIDSWCNSNCWEDMLRHLVHDECVRHALSAFAAMYLAVERTLDPSTQSSGSLARYSEGQMALRHYSTAISLCRQRLSDGITKDNIYSALTSTFLFALIEVLQNNIPTANQVIFNGEVLIRDTMKAKAPNGQSALVWDEELLDVKGGFDRVAMVWGLCPFVHGQDEPCAAVPNQYFEIPNVDAPMVTIKRCWGKFQTSLGLFTMSVRCGKVVPPELLEAVKEQRSKLVALLHEWTALLDTLLEREKDTAAFHRLSVIKACAVLYNIFFSCFLDRSNLAYDAHLQDFLEVLHICQRFIPDKQPAHYRLSLDIDLFPVVSFTVSKCRDQKTRQLALKVFREMTHRQVLWNNQGMLKSLQALVNLENDGRDKTGFIPASSRYCFVGSEWDVERRQMMALFVCAISEATESGDQPTVRVPISW